MRRPLRWIFLSFLAVVPLLAGLAHADSSAIRIGYVPSSVPGTAHFQIELFLGECGSDAACYLLDGGSGFFNAPGDDGAAVMATIDAVMATALCQGVPAFQTPVNIPGSTAGEIRHEYRINPTFLYDGIMISRIVFDRGAMSLGFVAPCGPYAPNVIGPYYVYFGGVPASAGDFKLLCPGKPEVDVAIDPAQSTQSMTSALVAAAKAAGIDAYPDGASAGFNSHPFQQDVVSLDYVGMRDRDPISLEIGNELGLWVPTKSETWGSVKARYR